MNECFEPIAFRLTFVALQVIHGHTGCNLEVPKVQYGFGPPPLRTTKNLRELQSQPLAWTLLGSPFAAPRASFWTPAGEDKIGAIFVFTFRPPFRGPFAAFCVSRWRGLAILAQGHLDIAPVFKLLPPAPSKVPSICLKTCFLVFLWVEPFCAAVGGLGV